MTDGLERPGWPAYLLTALVPGLGHGYLGYWRRGLVWLVLYAVAIAFLSARTLSAAFDPEAPFILTALRVEDVAYVDVAFPLAVLLVCLLDVYLRRLADRAGPGTDTGSRDDGGPGDD